MNELKIIENVQKFKTNYEDVKAELTVVLEKYKDLVITDDNVDEAEKTRKEITSIRTQISRFRGFGKKEIEKPLELFYKQTDELLRLVENVEKPIRERLLVYEEKRREDKAIEVQDTINTIAVELGLDEEYSSKIEISRSWLNRTQKKSATKKEIQERVCWFLDIQTKEREAAEFKRQKIEMATFMVESLSAGLVTPLTFKEIESKVYSLDIGALKQYIQAEVDKRREREERAKKLAEQAVLDRQEKERLEAERQEVKRIEAEQLAARKAQDSIEAAERAKKLEVERRQELLQHEQDEKPRQQYHIERTQVPSGSELQSREEHLQKLVDANKIPEKPVKQDLKLHNAQFVLYGVNAGEIEEVRNFFKELEIKFRFVVKDAD